jgi:hypothetical protein
MPSFRIDAEQVVRMRVTRPHPCQKLFVPHCDREEFDLRPQHFRTRRPADFDEPEHAQDFLPRRHIAFDYRFERLRVLGEPAFEEASENFPLAFEVPIQRAFAERGRFDEIVHRRGVVALLGETLRGGIEDLGAAFFFGFMLCHALESLD